MKTVGTFPFGQPIRPVSQIDRGEKSVFVLGVYASAVHARWEAPEGYEGIQALAVASEPEIFWRGEGVAEIVGSIHVPEGAGSLAPAASSLNGPSGQALDREFLEPLGLCREDAWLCDLVPHSCMNDSQKKALHDRYLPVMRMRRLPKPDWPELPAQMTDVERRNQIEEEVVASQATVIVTLGDLPLKWFTSFHGSERQLKDYGVDPGSYGRLHNIRIKGKDVALLPLVHPRQAGKLGAH